MNLENSVKMPKTSFLSVFLDCFPSFISLSFLSKYAVITWYGICLTCLAKVTFLYHCFYINVTLQSRTAENYHNILGFTCQKRDQQRTFGVRRTHFGFCFFHTCWILYFFLCISLSPLSPSRPDKASYSSCAFFSACSCCCCLLSWATWET